MRTIPFLALAASLIAPLAGAASSPGDVIQYCNATPNSTGFPAVLDFTGSIDATAEDLQFALSSAPAGNFAMLMMSYGSVGEYPFGNGVLCLNPYFPTGLHRVSLAVLGAGEITFDGILPATPQIGQWHYFQAFYRDVAAQGFNASTALAIEFTFPNS